jgi:acetyltransferase-like isoleucine patch superfamily enzyme
LGDQVVSGVGARIGAASPVYLGSRVRISKDVQIETAGMEFLTHTPPYPHISRAIRIDEGVWIGTRSLILGGVHIGAFSVISAGSVVTRSVPPRSVVAGIPARVIKTLDGFES